jgi:hypothetical protein
MEEDYKGIMETLHEFYPNGHPDYIPDMVKLMELHSKKNYDYAHGGDPLGNFDRVAEHFKMYPNLKNSDRVVVAITYAFKQIDAILHALDVGYNPEVDSLDARFQDVVVYFELARIMARGKCE